MDAQQQGESHVGIDGRSIPLDLLPFVPSVLGLLILLILHSLTHRSMQKVVDLSVEAREPRAGFGLVSPCPSWGGCYGTALAVDRLRCGVTKGGRSAAAGVEASKEAHAYATRGSTSWPPVRTSAYSNPLSLFQASTFIVQFSYWQDSSGGGGTRSSCGRNRVLRIDCLRKDSNNHH